MKRLPLSLVLFLFVASSSWAQKENNSGHSPLFHLEAKAELPHVLRETSGLFFHNARLWTHNDSGGNPMLYALDTATFEVVQKITLANAKNKDWEDVCTDGEKVFVGDFGNNNGKRKKLKIYTFPLSVIPKEGDATVEVDTIVFRFGDQTDFKKRKIHDFDCEAMFATEDYLYLFSKGWETGTTRLYRLSKTPGNQIAEVMNGFDSQGLVTGADYDRENRVLVLVGYVQTLWKPFMYLIFDFDEAGKTLANHRFEMPQLLAAQTEGVCFFDDGRCFVSAESSPTMSARVFVADFRQWIHEYQSHKER
ncbi:MAG: hypothetical protein IJ057_02095 [Bacteroidales bacterium]|nr:hypothetical protein [Bacteroidales bacterium]